MKWLRILWKTKWLIILIILIVGAMTMISGKILILSPQENLGYEEIKTLKRDDRVIYSYARDTLTARIETEILGQRFLLNGTAFGENRLNSLCNTIQHPNCPSRELLNYENRVGGSGNFKQIILGLRPVPENHLLRQIRINETWVNLVFTLESSAEMEIENDIIHAGSMNIDFNEMRKEYVEYILDRTGRPIGYRVNPQAYIPRIRQTGRNTAEVFVSLNPNYQLDLSDLIHIDPSVSQNFSQGSKDGITARANFAHMNVTNGDINVYAPFDVIHYTPIGEEGVNTQFDLSDNGLTFNSEVPPSFLGQSACLYGRCYTWNGVGDASFGIGNYGDNIFFNESFTATMWIYKNASSGLRDFAGTEPSIFSSKGWLLRISGNTLLAQANSISLQTIIGDVIEDNRWYHIAFVYNKTAPSISLYLNAVLNASTTTVNLADGLQTTIAGREFEVGRVKTNLGWNGSVDEVMLINGSLAVEDIENIFNNVTQKFNVQANQTFENLNLSEVGDENAVNITVNGSLFFGNENFSVMLGTTDEVSGYIYGNFTQITNGEAFNINISRPNNISVRLIYYSESANNFYTPYLIGNVTIDSFLIPPPIPPFAPGNIRRIIPNIPQGIPYLTPNNNYNKGAGIPYLTSNNNYNKGAGIPFVFSPTIS